MADLRIDLAAEFKGKKAFKEADSAVVKLEKNVKKLGSALGFTLGTAAVVAFGKASVKAFADDSAAALRLSNAVKNLGLEFANPYITDYIANLEKTSKIADDQLRPAFQRLLQQTGSIAKSQSILNTSIEVSRGSAVDLATVTEDLARAYYGNTKSLKKYSLGLTDAELKAKSFSEIQDILNSKFKGSSKAYLSTYQGQIDALSLSMNNLQESAGQALFTLASGGSGNVATGVNNLSGIIDAFGTGLVEAAKLFSNAANAFGQAYFGMASNAPAAQDLSKVPHGIPGKELFRSSVANDAKLKAIEKQQALLYKQQMSAQKALTAEQKKQAALKKEGKIFDLQQIELVAALKGKLSDDEKKRVEAQLALLNGNEAEAKRLTDQILMAQDSTGNLSRLLASLPDAKNPFQYLDAYLNGLAVKAAALGGLSTNGERAVTNINPASPALPTTNASNSLPSNAMISYNTQTGLSYNPNAIELKISGDSTLTKAIADSLQVQSLSGIPSSVQRLVSTFG